MNRRRLLQSGLGLGLLAVLGGCGVPVDSSPRDIPFPQQGDLGTDDATVLAGASVGDPRLYFVADGDGTAVLRPVSRDIDSSPRAVVQALLEGPSGEEQSLRGLRTSIPTGTPLRDVGLLRDGTLEIDLGDALLGAQGAVQAEAVAQLVFTATGLAGVDRVRLLVEGEPREWPRGDGSLESEPLTRFMYPGVNPTSRPDLPPVPDSP